MNQYGFADIQDWHLTLRSVIMAHAFHDEGRMQDAGIRTIFSTNAATKFT